MASGLSDGWLLEERGADVAHVVDEVGMIEDVEGGDAEVDQVGVVAGGLAQLEVVFPEGVEVLRSGGMEGIAPDSGRAGVTEAGVVIVGPGQLRVRRARVERDGEAEREPVVLVDGSHEVEAVQAIEVRARPLRGVGVVLVLWVRVDASGVVIGTAQRVLHLAGEPASGVCAQGDVERVGGEAASGFDLLHEAARGIGNLCVVGRKRGVCVTRAETGDAGDAAVARRESELCGQLALDVEAVLNGIRRTQIRRLADDARGQGGEGLARRKRVRVAGIQNLVRTQDDAVVELECGGIVAAGTVKKDPRAGANHGLPVKGIAYRDAGCEVFPRGNVGLPLIAEAEGEKEIGVDLNLILGERPDLIDPIEAAARTLLAGEDIGCWIGPRVVGEGVEAECAEAVGLVVDRAPADLGDVRAEADVVFFVGERHNLTDVYSVFRTGQIGLRAATGERRIYLDGWSVGDAAGIILVFFKGDLQLIDEAGGHDDAFVEDEVVFSRDVVKASFRQDETANTVVARGVDFEVIADGKPVRIGEIVRNAERGLVVAARLWRALCDGPRAPIACT